MTLLYSAIIFINNDLTSSVQDTLTQQLMLTEIIDGYEFDTRVANDPNYPTEIHLNMLRVMVMRSYFDQTNRNLADIVLFFKAGLIYVEENKVGPPGLTLPAARIQLTELINPVKILTDGYVNCNPNIQSNILYPLFSHQTVFQYPFGTDPLKQS